MRGVQSLIVFLALTMAASATGVLFHPGDWYAALQKPSFNPPNWIFPPVWTLLYVMMAVAAWRVWRRDGMSPPLVLWAIQLLLNAAWTWLFFGKHLPASAFADILVLLLAIAITAVAFWRRDRVAGLLLVPYLAWVAFACALNYALWQLNPAA
ncbi:TspO/MBR family protein [Paraburkholderia sp.]|uniref:TspO/MBR family protein n=1 Tax=Paraburkholderia sp. TaxID=1926495 RepID=UPI0023A41B9E|nr:TspO/MBR family protein [Paraburkholderia sp.]MDE1182097.1 tryptophan-rich sensory protein [Paraburkholderia sp.]